MRRFDSIFVISGAIFAATIMGFAETARGSAVSRLRNSIARSGQMRENPHLPCDPRNVSLIPFTKE